MDARYLIKQRREAREKRVKKKEHTVEAKLAFGINEKVHVKCPKSKQWNLRGIIKEVRINEQGTICSYLVQLENRLDTVRHICF